MSTVFFCDAMHDRGRVLAVCALVGVNLALNINARVRSSNKDGSAENEMAIDGDADTFWIGDQNDHAWWLEVCAM